MSSKQAAEELCEAWKDNANDPWWQELFVQMGMPDELPPDIIKRVADKSGKDCAKPLPPKVQDCRGVPLGVPPTPQTLCKPVGASAAMEDASEDELLKVKPDEDWVTKVSKDFTKNMFSIFVTTKVIVLPHIAGTLTTNILVCWHSGG